MPKLKCPGAKDILEPLPQSIDCPNCGREVEIWSDEFFAECDSCHSRILKDKDLPSCVQWCKEAKKCIGEKLYKKYIKGRT